MNPAKIKDIAQKYSEQTSIPAEDIKMMAERMFAGIRKMMTDMTSPIIYEEHFGKFFFKKWVVNRLVNKAEKDVYIKRGVEVYKNKAQQELDKLLNMKQMMYHNTAVSINRYKRDEHKPSELNYNKGCRCADCKAEKMISKRAYEKKLKELKELEKFRTDDTERKVTEGLGE